MLRLAVLGAFFLFTLLIGCDQLGLGKVPNQRSAAEMDAAITKLQNEVRGLEQALANLMNNTSKWVLWRAIEFAVPGGGNLAPKPFGAYGTKAECEAAAQTEVEAVASTGTGKQLNLHSYSFSYREFGVPSTAVAIFTCLPDTVNPLPPVRK